MHRPSLVELTAGLFPNGHELDLSRSRYRNRLDFILLLQIFNKSLFSWKLKFNPIACNLLPIPVYIKEDTVEVNIFSMYTGRPAQRQTRRLDSVVKPSLGYAISPTTSPPPTLWTAGEKNPRKCKVRITYTVQYISISVLEFIWGGSGFLPTVWWQVSYYTRSVSSNRSHSSLLMLAFENTSSTTENIFSKFENNSSKVLKIPHKSLKIPPYRLKIFPQWIKYLLNIGKYLPNILKIPPRRLKIPPQRLKIPP